MNAKFISSIIRFTFAKDSVAKASSMPNDAYWIALKNRVRRASEVIVPICVLASHFEACSRVTPEEREAHLECPLCEEGVALNVSRGR